jgi:hypothetical protein
MSQKHPRPVPAGNLARRVLVGVLVGVVLVAVAVVVIGRLRDDSTPATVATVPPASPPSTSAPSELSGTYDVTLTVSSAEYGATWPASAAQLVPGQKVPQRWSIECSGPTCAIDVISGHIPEDPDGAVVSALDENSFQASGTAPARADGPGQPAGCGAVNAIDRQQLTLTATNDLLSGSYVVHHPVIHVEGPVGATTGSCDSFNVVLTLTGRQVR